MTADIEANLGQQRLAGEQSRHRHRWIIHPSPAMLEDADFRMRCPCGQRQDVAKSKRGRNARSRGNAYELDVAKRLGGRKVGMYGGPEDIVLPHMVVQAKVGGAFPERVWRWLQQLPHDHRLRAVVIGDAPGPGHRRREVIVLDLADFADWYGGTKEAPYD